MDFEELAFQTRAPYIDCDSNCVRFAFASPQKYLGGDATDDGCGSSGGLSGFPVSINDIGLTMRNGPSGPKAGLEFTLSLNLTGETNTFSAATSLAILGKLNLDGGQGQVWEFDGVELDSIGVSGSVGVVSISGGLRFYNNDATANFAVQTSVNTGSSGASWLPSGTMTANAFFTGHWVAISEL
jgi:hypothetical protein